jgi:hypothetical protein
MEHIFSEKIHKTKHYVVVDGVEYLRQYDYVDLPILTWIKDPSGEIGKPEVLTDYTELEELFNKTSQ